LSERHTHEVIVTMEGFCKLNGEFVPRTEVDLSRGGCPEPTRNGCSGATVEKLDDVLSAGKADPRKVRTLQTGSSIGQLFTVVQENRREAEFVLAGADRKRRRDDATEHFSGRWKQGGVTGRSFSRECRRLGVISQRSEPVSMDFSGVFVDGKYREPPENRDDAMPIDSDRMSIVSSEPEPMDTSEAMDCIDSVGELTETVVSLNLACDLFESFFANASIDEKGRVVRRSPRLGGATGSFFVPSSDGRTLRRRSARTRQN
jgi:hypothetical protein